MGVIGVIITFVITLAACLSPFWWWMVRNAWLILFRNGHDTKIELTEDRGNVYYPNRHCVDWKVTGPVQMWKDGRKSETGYAFANTLKEAFSDAREASNLAAKLVQPVKKVKPKPLAKVSYRIDRHGDVQDIKEN